MGAPAVKEPDAATFATPTGGLADLFWRAPELGRASSSSKLPNTDWIYLPKRPSSKSDGAKLLSSTCCVSLRRLPVPTRRLSVELGSSTSKIEL